MDHPHLFSKIFDNIFCRFSIFLFLFLFIWKKNNRTLFDIYLFIEFVSYQNILIFFNKIFLRVCSYIFIFLGEKKKNR
jgi:hypothetical protein